MDKILVAIAVVAGIFFADETCPMPIEHYPYMVAHVSQDNSKESQDILNTAYVNMMAVLSASMGAKNSLLDGIECQIYGLTEQFKLFSVCTLEKEGYKFRTLGVFNKIIVLNGK